MKEGKLVLVSSRYLPEVDGMVVIATRNCPLDVYPYTIHEVFRGSCPVLRKEITFIGGEL